MSIRRASEGQKPEQKGFPPSFCLFVCFKDGGSHSGWAAAHRNPSPSVC